MVCSARPGSITLFTDADVGDNTGELVIRRDEITGTVFNLSLGQHLEDRAWWRDHMETFSALLVSCAGNSPVTGEFSAQRPATRSFDAFFRLCLNKRLSKQSWGWWFETLSRPLWRHCKKWTRNSVTLIKTSSHYKQEQACFKSVSWQCLLQWENTYAL